MKGLLKININHLINFLYYYLILDVIIKRFDNLTSGNNTIRSIYCY